MLLLKLLLVCKATRLEKGSVAFRTLATPVQNLINVFNSTTLILAAAGNSRVRSRLAQ